MTSEHDNNIRTPAYVFDLMELADTAGQVADMCHACGLRLLYPLKAAAAGDVLQTLSRVVDGFAASSPFEARLAREFANNGQSVHFTSPGIRPGDVTEIAETCEYAACNSVRQLGMFSGAPAAGTRVGIRINPQLSFLEDDRYDPCRRHSKLGIPLDTVTQLLASGALPLDTISGLHFHSNSESPSLVPLLRTVEHVESKLTPLFRHIDWINLGGGYLFDDPDDDTVLARIARALCERYGLDVFVEPGTAVVADCCTLVTTVLDVFPSQGKSVAVLDTTVNHFPEVFEFAYRPRVASEADDGDHGYILAGSTCLAGDLFGEYRFRRPLEVGDRLHILNCGAYSLVKADMFNGINLPSIYTVSEADAQPRLTCSFSYGDYRSRFG